MIRYLCVFLIIASTSAWAEVFKWVDQNGKPHYSDNPPPSNPHKDLSSKLEAPPCNKECQDNVQSQQQYRQQYLQERLQSEAKRRAELESSNKSTQQTQTAQDAKQQQEELDAKARSQAERKRVPSSHIRTP